MAEFDVNIAVPRSHARSFADVLKSLVAEGITVCQEMPEIGIIRVKVDDLKKLDPLRREGLPVEEGRRDVGMALPGGGPPPASTPAPPQPQTQAQDPPPAAPQPTLEFPPATPTPPRTTSPAGWRSPLSDR